LFISTTKLVIYLQLSPLFLIFFHLFFNDLDGGKLEYDNSTGETKPSEKSIIWNVMAVGGGHPSGSSIFQKFIRCFFYGEGQVCSFRDGLEYGDVYFRHRDGYFWYEEDLEKDLAESHFLNCNGQYRMQVFPFTPSNALLIAKAKKEKEKEKAQQETARKENEAQAPQDIEEQLKEKERKSIQNSLKERNERYQSELEAKKKELQAENLPEYYILSQALTRFSISDGGRTKLFSEGLLPVYDRKSHSFDRYVHGYIDKEGKLVVPITYKTSRASLGSFSEGLAAVPNPQVGISPKIGFIDKTGKEIIPFIYDEAKDFHEGLAAVKKADRWGYIDKTGKEITPFTQNSGIGYFSEGLAAFSQNDRWGFIDKTGAQVIPFIFSSVSEFSEGLAAVLYKGKWGFMDKTGNEVIPCIYESRVSQFSEGLAAICEKGRSIGEDKRGFIDKTGKQIIPPTYMLVSYFSEGLVAVYNGEKWGFIDKTGKEIIPFIYDGAKDFHEGLAAVAVREVGGDLHLNWGFIDKEGNEVIPPVLGDVYNDFSNGLALVSYKNRLLCFIDNKGYLIGKGFVEKLK
jgi:hypothetical protein